MSREGVCNICGGNRSEHGPDSGRVHAYTEREGELKSQAQADQEAMKRTFVQLPANVGSHPTVTDRMVEVMLRKGLIDREDALYILVGIQPESASLSDPAVRMKRG